MRILIDETENSKTYEFKHLNCIKIVKYEIQEGQSQVADFDKVSEEEHSDWIKWLGKL